VEWLSAKMRDNNFTVSTMHGDMPQQERDAIMGEFRSAATRVLITTDVWARGLDMLNKTAKIVGILKVGINDKTVSLVINYDLPNNRELYIHRIGRSGRFGRKHVLKLQNQELTDKICNKLGGHYTDLSSRKGGSNVMEKCISSSNKEMKYGVEEFLENRRHSANLPATSMFRIESIIDVLQPSSTRTRVSRTVRSEIIVSESVSKENVDDANVTPIVAIEHRACHDH
ncbi:hypothetical protein RJ640_002653, partial [Escallonia rubra]